MDLTGLTPKSIIFLMVIFLVRSSLPKQQPPNSLEHTFDFGNREMCSFHLRCREFLLFQLKFELNLTIWGC